MAVAPVHRPLAHFSTWKSAAAAGSGKTSAAEFGRNSSAGGQTSAGVPGRQSSAVEVS